MLEVRGLTKSFPAVTALEDVNLIVPPGEVYGIIGENGAGKSTLMKLLSGIYEPTAGQILWDGQEVRFRSPADAIRAGIVMIHQELNLVDQLSVADNIFLGREKTRGGRLDKAATRSEAERLLEQVGASFAPDEPVGNLSVAGKQLVEIAKALSYDARLIIMDEPTAVLSEHESSALFALMRNLKDRGVSILFISHHLSEVREHCQTVSVLRDGRLVSTFPAESATEDEMARLMVGRELSEQFPQRAAPTDRVALKVTGLSVLNWVHDFSLEIRAGEVVGLAGLVGSGRTETAEAIVGLRPRLGGQIEVTGQEVRGRRPIDAVRAGLAYVSEDRKGRGLVLPMDTRQNLTLANLSRYARPVIRSREEEAAVDRWVKDLQIRVPDRRAPILYLSGGNQQKVSVAKWLDTEPKALLLDEPTRGVDIGAKREIYGLIQDLASKGMACLVISSEMPELIGLCHRILVMRNGRIVGEVTSENMNEHEIMRLAAGLQGQVAA